MIFNADNARFAGVMRGETLPAITNICLFKKYARPVDENKSKMPNSNATDRAQYQS
jgi:hypothetical protein